MKPGGSCNVAIWWDLEGVWEVDLIIFIHVYV